MAKRLTCDGESFVVHVFMKDRKQREIDISVVQV